MIRLLIVFLSPLFSYNQTVIVGYVTDTEIYFAADGKATAFDYNLSKEIPYKACKIVSVNSFHFLMSGTKSEIIPAIAKPYFLSSTYNVLQALKLFEVALRDTLTYWLSFSQRKNLEHYKKMYSKDKLFIQAYLGYFENNTPKIYSIECQVLNEYNEKVRVKVIINSKTIDPTPFIVTAGEYSEVPMVIDKLNGLLSPDLLLCEAILAQAQKTPKKVAEPISILKITSNGAHFTHPGAC